MESAQAGLTVRGGTVRMTMSAKVAGDLGALQRSLKSLAERLGHPACATGCDILHLGMEREFTFGGAGNEVALNPQPLPPRELIAGPTPDPWRPVTVAISDKVSRDINLLTKATASVLGKLGCGQCCSGFDILFRRELDMLSVDENANVQGFGRFR
jgi:hypothetical protein